ncbi:MAG: hypothetical protein C0602_03565 [Denitrovibrio sp.]|nr:MAG: hypothetical protein C0602_03565 [Denitrovibrio sp.]
MQKIKVLIAEDDKLNRVLICKLLEKYGASCVTAEDGSVALEKCFAEEFDIVMLDYNMPGYTGVECAQKIKEWFKEKEAERPFIVGVSADDEHGNNKAFDTFLSKPFQVEKIKKILSAHLKED